jgi:hypothetical protein
MKPLLWTLMQILTITGVIFLEMSPNKYVANIMVLFKTWAALQATVLWTLILTFSMKVPSQSTVNNAVHFTLDEKVSRLRRFNRWLQRVLLFLGIGVCLACGQWFLFICFVGITSGFLSIKSSAQKYLNNVKVDLEKKAAVIDV